MNSGLIARLDDGALSQSYLDALVVHLALRPDVRFHKLLHECLAVRETSVSQTSRPVSTKLHVRASLHQQSYHVGLLATHVPYPFRYVVVLCDLPWSFQMLFACLLIMASCYQIFRGFGENIVASSCSMCRIWCHPASNTSCSNISRQVLLQVVGRRHNSTSVTLHGQPGQYSAVYDN
jgi:hypothetical protein